MSVKTIILLSFLLTIYWTSFGQDYSYKHYDSEDGLPSSEIYHVNKDSKGYLWFCTDNGISKFNGTEFINYGLKQGLPHKVVFRSFEDEKGRMWFTTFGEKLFYVENNKVINYAGNDSIVKFFNSLSHKKSNFVFKDFHVKNDTVFFSIPSAAVYKINPDYSIHEISNKVRGDKRRISIHYVDSNNTVSGRLTGENNLSYLYNIEIHQKNDTRSLNKVIPFSVNQGTYVKHYAKDKLVLGLGNRLAWINKNDIKVSNTELPGAIVWIEVDSFGKIWVGLINHGVRVYDSFGDQLPTKILLKGNTVSSILNTGNSYWVTSTNNGVFFIPNYTIKSYWINNKPNTQVNDIKSHADKLYYSSFKDFGSLKHNHFKTSSFFDESNLTANFYKIKPLKDSLLFLSSLGIVVQSDKKTQFHRITTGVRDLFKLDSSWIYAGSGTLVEVDHPFRNINTNIEPLKTFSRVHQIVKDDKKNIWLATPKGPFKYQNHQVIPIIDTAFNQSISVMVPYKSGMLLGTSTSGLIYYQKDSLKWILDEKVGLSSNSIRDILFRTDSTLWLATGKGLHLIHLRPKPEIKAILTTNDGLISNDINALDLAHDTLWLATSKGISSISLRRLNTVKKPVELEIKNVKVFNSMFRFSNDFTLPYDSNFISFEFQSIEHQYQNEVEYYYSIPRMSSEWIVTNTPMVNLNGLSPGKYEILIKAKRKGVYPFGRIQNVTFTINPPFWLTWWFISLSVLTFALVTYLSIRYRYRQILQKERMKQEVLEKEKESILYRQKALRSQMNPHFIFNALNSIYNFILTEESKKASYYLTEFSKLIRGILNSSKQELITIEDEIDLLKHFMELEKMQKTFDFDYSFEIDSNIDAEDVSIPSMILQPFIENAIIHGVKPLTERKGKISIKFEPKSDDSLVCIIEDNGIGREKSSKLKGQERVKHKSIGINNTKERLDLINNEFESNLEVHFEDLKFGTRVIVTLPMEDFI